MTLAVKVALNPNKTNQSFYFLYSSCIVHIFLTVCDKRPVHDISKYEQHVGNGHWLEMPCGLGTGFNIVDCGCTLNIVVVPGFGKII